MWRKLRKVHSLDSSAIILLEKMQRVTNFFGIELEWPGTLGSLEAILTIMHFCMVN